MHNSEDPSQVKVHGLAALWVGFSLQPSHNDIYMGGKDRLMVQEPQKRSPSCSFPGPVWWEVTSSTATPCPHRNNHPWMHVSGPTTELPSSYMPSAFTKQKGMKRSVRKVCIPEVHILPTTFPLRGSEPLGQHHRGRKEQSSLSEGDDTQPGLHSQTSKSVQADLCHRMP